MENGMGSPFADSLPENLGIEKSCCTRAVRWLIPDRAGLLAHPSRCLPECLSKQWRCV
jgi:hypothetical protein